MSTKEDKTLSQLYQQAENPKSPEKVDNYVLALAEQEAENMRPSRFGPQTVAAVASACVLVLAVSFVFNNPSEDLQRNTTPAAYQPQFEQESAPAVRLQAKPVSSPVTSSAKGQALSPRSPDTITEAKAETETHDSHAEMDTSRAYEIGGAASLHEESVEEAVTESRTSTMSTLERQDNSNAVRHLKKSAKQALSDDNAATEVSPANVVSMPLRMSPPPREKQKLDTVELEHIEALLEQKKYAEASAQFTRFKERYPTLLDTPRIRSIIETLATHSTQDK